MALLHHTGDIISSDFSPGNAFSFIRLRIRVYRETDTRWEQCVSDRADHEVARLRMPLRQQVSNVEVKLLDEIRLEHGDKTQWQLVVIRVEVFGAPKVNPTEPAKLILKKV